MLNYRKQLCEAARERLFTNTYKNPSQKRDDQMIVILCEVAENLDTVAGNQKASEEANRKLDRVIQHVNDIDRLKKRFLIGIASALTLLVAVIEAVSRLF